MGPFNTLNFSIFVRTAVLIPAFNNDWALNSLIEAISTHFSKSNIFVVNDGSTDSTSKVLQEIEGINLLEHNKNKGKGAALKTGFEAIRDKGFEWVITMDGDGQHSPDDLPAFLNAEKEAGDLLMGKRDFSLKKMPLFRIFSNTITSFLLTRICGQSVMDSQCGYRKIRTNWITMKMSTGHFQYESEFLIQAARKGCRLGHVPIRTLYNSRVSSMRHFKDTWEFIKLIWKYL